MIISFSSAAFQFGRAVIIEFGDMASRNTGSKYQIHALQRGVATISANN